MIPLVSERKARACAGRYDFSQYPGFHHVTIRFTVHGRLRPDLLIRLRVYTPVTLKEAS